MACLRALASLRSLPVALVLAAGALNPAPAAESQSPPWVRVAGGEMARRTGAALVHAPDLERMLLVGPAADAPCVQAFDPSARRWSTFSESAPAKTFRRV